MFDADPTAVDLGRFVTSAPEAVWRALTESDLVAQWLARPVGMVAEVGVVFVFEIPSDPPGEAACEVLVVEPKRRFEHTYTDLRAKRPARWVIRWSLVPKGRGTRVVFRFDGFDANDRMQRMARNALERGYDRTVLPELAEFVSTMR
ncbi:SRPBCC family protein [Gordonia shandongensis]|uniref:SRPBCC family protein n=1 Tax=Gordonia shandongensis TaxID=376351 RepID=UPI00054E289B|nr:SRPBCC domain-containing protein [Gordonia shandongensis]